jgi:hypothetical protein
MYDELTRNSLAAARAAIPHQSLPGPALANLPNSFALVANPSLPPQLVVNRTESHFIPR